MAKTKHENLCDAKVCELVSVSHIDFVDYLPLTNRARGPYWGILARGRDSTDRAQRGPYKND